MLMFVWALWLLGALYADVGIGVNDDSCFHCLCVLYVTMSLAKIAVEMSRSCPVVLSCLAGMEKRGNIEGNGSEI